MYQKKNIRVYIAWMLFMTFIPFFIMEVRMKSRVPMQSILTNHLMIVRSANTPFLSLLNLNR